MTGVVGLWITGGAPGDVSVPDDIALVAADGADFSKSASSSTDSNDEATSSFSM
jgi:hypothetical protein